MKTVEERLKSYEPLWEKWKYSGEFLGEGAMSSVFEIESNAMGFREVAALKIVTVKKNFRGEVKIPENALNEIKILRDLAGCPNIVQYHDSTQRQIFDENGVLAEIDILIKMEKLNSLSESDNLSEAQIIKLAKDMCVALSYASEHGIIHRDIKPQNIFVDDEGTYKLGDFGIAKILSDFSGAYTMNVGTLAYTAPEVRSAVGGTYDIASDIYSLGLVLYIFLNHGRMPFAESSISLNEAVTKRLSGAKFPSPALGSKNLKTIVMRACNADLNKRYRTPKEMLEDLELLSTGGKKMVVDPFATLDANIDVLESEMIAGGERPPMSMGATSAPTHTAAPGASTSGGLKMSMRPPAKPAPAAKKPPETTVSTVPHVAKPAVSSAPTGMTSSGSGLKSTLRPASRTMDGTPPVTPARAPVAPKPPVTPAASVTSTGMTSSGSGLKSTLRPASRTMDGTPPVAPSRPPVAPPSPTPVRPAAPKAPKKEEPKGGGFFSNPEL